MSAGYIQALCKRTFLAKTLLLSPEKVKTIASATSGQRSNPMWSIVRRHRITSSNFGFILRAIQRNSYPPSFWKRLSSPYNLEKKDSIAWGINHERNAIDQYHKLGAKVEETGIWLHESGILGASPDGIVLTPIPQSATPPPDIIEVKCPFSARDKPPLDAIGQKNFCLVRTDGRITLPNDHEYYHQIQGQLYIMGKTCCDLLIWTSRGHTQNIPGSRMGFKYLKADRFLL
ncbi:LOW QUALITY PROTEIN: uncharacterized protein LOC124266603 [Haliotis rubra]|uniref:LOW QUALITY PROTEIN: uncharacterized protein LOC124266603 n=1 Tax=Haliotis rubra TaxID=36100 RepID=UPI001EE5345A|nr:LOW QUALITY PROTEIN: uncharacterized protein LOC124266603 [Haliotis rubra]